MCANCRGHCMVIEVINFKVKAFWGHGDLPTEKYLATSHPGLMFWTPAAWVRFVSNLNTYGASIQSFSASIPCYLRLTSRLLNLLWDNFQPSVQTNVAQQRQICLYGWGWRVGCALRGEKDMERDRVYAASSNQDAGHIPTYGFAVNLVTQLPSALTSGW